MGSGFMGISGLNKVFAWGVLFVCAQVRGEVPVITWDTPMVEVGGVLVTAIELAQQPAFQKEFSGESGLLDMRKEIDRFILDVVFAAMGKRLGALDSKAFHEEYKNVRKLLLWQDFYRREAAFFSSFPKVAEGNSGNFKMDFNRSDWEPIARNFQFACRLSSESKRSLSFNIVGSSVRFLLPICSIRNKEERAIAYDFALKNEKKPKDAALLRWNYGGICGEYSINSFFEDFQGMPIKKMDISLSDLVQLAIDQFLAREYVACQLFNGLDRKRELLLGLEQIGRRFAQKQFLLNVSQQIPVKSSERELRLFFESNDTRFEIPERIRAVRFNVDAIDRRDALKKRINFLKYLRKKQEVGGSQWSAFSISSHEAFSVSREDPSFFQLLSVQKNEFSGIIEKDGFYCFYQIKGHEGGGRPSFEEVLPLVQKAWRSDHFKSRLEVLKTKFLSEHKLCVHPEMEQFIQSDYFKKFRTTQAL